MKKMSLIILATAALTLTACQTTGTTGEKTMVENPGGTAAINSGNKERVIPNADSMTDHMSDTMSSETMSDTMSDGMTTHM